MADKTKHFLDLIEDMVHQWRKEVKIDLKGRGEQNKKLHLVKTRPLNFSKDVETILIQQLRVEKKEERIENVILKDVKKLRGLLIETLKHPTTPTGAYSAIEKDLGMKGLKISKEELEEAHKIVNLIEERENLLKDQKKLLFKGKINDLEKSVEKEESLIKQGEQYLKQQKKHLSELHYIEEAEKKLHPEFKKSKGKRMIAPVALIAVVVILALFVGPELSSRGNRTSAAELSSGTGVNPFLSQLSTAAINMDLNAFQNSLTDLESGISDGTITGEPGEIESAVKNSFNTFVARERNYVNAESSLELLKFESNIQGLKSVISNQDVFDVNKGALLNDMGEVESDFNEKRLFIVQVNQGFVPSLVGGRNIRIQYSVPEYSHVTLRVCEDINCRLAETILDQDSNGGTDFAEWVADKGGFHTFTIEVRKDGEVKARISKPLRIS